MIRSNDLCRVDLKVICLIKKGILIKVIHPIMIFKVQNIPEDISVSLMIRLIFSMICNGTNKATAYKKLDMLMLKNVFTLMNLLSNPIGYNPYLIRKQFRKRGSESCFSLLFNA